MTRRKGTYEVRNDQLFLNGERVGTDRRVVRETLRTHGRELGKSGEISFMVASEILERDRKIGLVRLQAELAAAVA